MKRAVGVIVAVLLFQIPAVVGAQELPEGSAFFVTPDGRIELHVSRAQTLDADSAVVQFVRYMGMVDTLAVQASSRLVVELSRVPQSIEIPGYDGEVQRSHRAVSWDPGLAVGESQAFSVCAVWSSTESSCWEFAVLGVDDAE